MRILVACEYSGVVRRAFARRGHDVVSCDIIPAEIPMYEPDAGRHFVGDVVPLLQDSWDLIIGHPPCTRLCNSGGFWIEKRGLQSEFEAGAEFFNRLKNASCERICLENPIPHGLAVSRIGKYTQIIQPWMFGHGHTKATCLWLKNLPLLKPTNIVSGRYPKTHLMSPGPERAKERARTYTGIAEAMADQWGCL